MLIQSGQPCAYSKRFLDLVLVIENTYVGREEKREAIEKFRAFKQTPPMTLRYYRGRFCELVKEAEAVHGMS